jgi:hypothetical protein
MTRQARRTLSAWIVVAMAVGALLVAPARAGAATAPSGHQMAVAPAPQRIDPGELRRLLDQIVAAGAPGAAALVVREHRSLGRVSLNLARGSRSLDGASDRP